MKVIITGGGTAGHVNPALAIAEEIKRREKDAEILFIGRDGGTENNAVIDAGVNISYLKIKGIERRITFRNINSLILALKAVSEAGKIIDSFKPDIIVGTGGYVSWPVIRAGQKRRIPTVIHESNVSPGLTTKLVAKKCNSVLLNHQETKKYFTKQENISVVGNPLRSDFEKIKRVTARAELKLRKNDIFIVSFGGSIGSEKLNNTVIALMKNYSSKKDNVNHIHATGIKYYDMISEKKFKDGASGCKIVSYIKNMPTLLKAADIVISRCGAMTLSELALVGAPAILIPSPNVTDDHQYKNAKHLSDESAAIMITEDVLDEHILTENVKKLCKNEDLRKKLSICIEKFAIKDSGEKIYKILKSTISAKK